MIDHGQGLIFPNPDLRYGLPVDDPADAPAGAGWDGDFEPCATCGGYYYPKGDMCPACGDEPTKEGRSEHHRST